MSRILMIAAFSGKMQERVLLRTASYAGACIHVPPPSPNQMVYAQVAAKLAPDSINNAYAVTGVLRTQGKILGLGGAAYTIEVKAIERLR